MNETQQEYFRRKLFSWREEILRGSNETLRQLKEEDNRVADMSDWASFETERNFQLRARDRERKLLAKIDEALQAGSRMAPTAIARRPRSRSVCAASRRGRSRP